MRRLKLMLPFGLIMLTVLACSLPAAISRSGQQPTPTRRAINTPTAVPTLTPTLPQNQAIAATATPAFADSAIPVQDDPCLQGTWNITNLETAVLASIPGDMLQSYQITYKETHGSAQMTFSPGHHLSLRANQLEMIFNARVSILQVPLTAAIDGEASGDYQLNGNTLTTQNMKSDGLSASVKLMGKDLIDPAQILASMPLVQPPLNTATYTCQGDTLQLRILAYGDSVPPLVFKRVQN